MRRIAGRPAGPGRLPDGGLRGRRGSGLPGVRTNRYAYAGNDPINKSDQNGHIFGSEALSIFDSFFSSPKAPELGARAAVAAAGAMAWALPTVALAAVFVIATTTEIADDDPNNNQPPSFEPTSNASSSAAGSPDPEDDNNDRRNEDDKGKQVNRMSESQLNKAAKSKSYDAIHQFKCDLNLKQNVDIFVEKKEICFRAEYDDINGNPQWKDFILI